MKEKSSNQKQKAGVRQQNKEAYNFDNSKIDSMRISAKQSNFNKV